MEIMFKDLSALLLVFYGILAMCSLLFEVLAWQIVAAQKIPPTGCVSLIFNIFYCLLSSSLFVYVCMRVSSFVLPENKKPAEIAIKTSGGVLVFTTHSEALAAFVMKTLANTTFENNESTLALAQTDEPTTQHATPKPDISDMDADTPSTTPAPASPHAAQA